jgi:hypothetical protein
VPPAAPYDPYALGGNLLGRCCSVGLAQQRRAVSTTGQLGGHPLEEDLRTAAFRVPGVPPIQEQNVTISGVRHGLLGHPY